MKSFYNTTLEAFTEADEYDKIANAQEQQILSFAIANPHDVFSSETCRVLFSDKTPTTSIRRAICNLKRDGKLEIVGKTAGSYGRMIFTYRLVK